MHALSTVALTAGLLSLTLPAAAQSVQPPGDVSSQVRVTDVQGLVTRGVLLSADADTFRLLTSDGDRLLSRSSVVKVEQRGDSVRNGFIIGAVIGLVPGALAVGEIDNAGGVTMAIVAGSLFYGAAGAGIDALHTGWTTVYTRPTPASSRKHRLWAAPMAAGMRVGYTRRF